MQRGEFAEAERLLRQVETTHPPCTDRVRFNLAGVLAMQGRNQEAEAMAAAGLADIERRRGS